MFTNGFRRTKIINKDMNIQAGQLKVVQSVHSNVKESDCNVLAEGGNDNGTTFNGRFLVKVIVNRKRLNLSFDNGKLSKTL